ncbi:D-alanyl-D-alanine carboxypeptidase [Litoreibacter ascidiaceicola]|uniref:D-alanyl-D-alanine carboxypeptidase n=1 Tax=Litoreibacter ascidiaceicola TaxID=1486859 RepID=A0A1M5APW1_9RHOB|nr:serine hydrolase [Litoreibacter ascidiaceicola]SHF31962.1 D-alanyl-D-alanine carboxypeptidase [Litoreibacter ascidiaceicola]
MTQFDPVAINGGVSEVINSYDGPAPALIFEAYRDGVSVSAATGTVGLDDLTVATTDDKFEIGSQTKMMTTTVLLQLVDEGHFSLDDRLVDVMDVTPLSWMPNIEEVTIEQLMTHKSGIPDYVNTVGVQQGMEELLSQDPPQPIGVEEFLQLFEAANLPATAEPGAEISYSNTGFTLLGLLIENATGSSLADEFQTRIFDPAGMSSTSLPSFELPDGVLKSYLAVTNDLFLEVTDLPIAEHGEGGVISTTGDMIRFMKALVIDGTLVPESQMGALEEFFASVSDTADSEFIGHQGASFGSLSVTLVHMPTGTIFSAVETMRYGQADLSEEVYEAFGELLGNPALHTDYTNGDDIDFAASAADLEINETMGTDGDLETLLTIDGVTLSFDGSLSTLETEKLSFEDGSILFVADAAGSDFHVQHMARDAATADNQIVGLSGDDHLVGGRGDDKISGGAGDDHLIGRRGDDTILGDEGDDNIAGNRGNDYLSGGNGNDNISGGRGDDWLDGGSGDDLLRGGRGDDNLSGSTGDDILRGGRGNDTLDGGEGDDILVGGRGADTFVFSANSGDDVIRKFESGKDQIDLTLLNLTYEDLQVAESRGERSFEVQLDDASLVINTLHGELAESDFLF